jgi:hypothetical protein
MRGLLGPFWLVKTPYASESCDSNIKFGHAIWTRKEARRYRESRRFGETRGRAIPRPQKPVYTRGGNMCKNRTAVQSRRQGAQTKADALSREDLAQRVINSRSLPVVFYRVLSS